MGIRAVDILAHDPGSVRRDRWKPELAAHPCSHSRSACSIRVHRPNLLLRSGRVVTLKCDHSRRALGRIRIAARSIANLSEAGACRAHPKDLLETCNLAVV